MVSWSVRPYFLLYKKPLLVVRWRFRVQHAHACTQQLNKLSKYRTLFSIHVCKTFSIRSMPIMVGTCGMLPHFARSHSFCPSVILEHNHQWSFWLFWSVANCFLQVLHAGTGAVSLRCRAGLLRISVPWPSDGTKRLWGAHSICCWCTLSLGPLWLPIFHRWLCFQFVNGASDALSMSRNALDFCGWCALWDSIQLCWWGGVCIDWTVHSVANAK